MSQPLPLFPEVCKTVTGVIAPTNAGEIILRFSITGGELDSVPQGTQTQKGSAVGPGLTYPGC